MPRVTSAVDGYSSGGIRVPSGVSTEICATHAAIIAAASAATPSTSACVSAPDSTSRRGKTATGSRVAHAFSSSRVRYLNALPGSGPFWW